MNRQKLFIFALAAVFCATLFLGCATTPKKDLEEKEAIIQDLNNRIAGMNQEIESLKNTNRQLENARGELETRISELEQAARQKRAAQVPDEPNLK